MREYAEPWLAGMRFEEDEVDAYVVLRFLGGRSERFRLTEAERKLWSRRGWKFHVVGEST